jgi:muramoyltetrapeptide carboxypeptidase
MKRTIIPPFLDRGSGIAIVAPSRYAEKDVIDLAESWIKKQGWVPYRAPNLGAKENQFGGSDQERSDDFNWAISNPDVRAIWSIRGGYGAVRIVDHINWGNLKKQPKWIIGFSDFTVLLSHTIANEILGVHSWMPLQIPSLSNKSLNGLADLLEGKPSVIKANHNSINNNGTATGKLVGGNLSVLYSLLGSNSFPKLDGCILALEDLDEYKYHIDRMMNAMRRSHVFNHLSGVVIGSFSDIKDNERKFGKEVYEIIKANIPSKIPIGVDFPFGHTSKNEPFINGLNYQLEVTNSGSRLEPLSIT